MADDNANPDWFPIDDTMPQLEFFPAENWETLRDRSPANEDWEPWNNTYHTSTKGESYFFVQFHGDGLDLWGHFTTPNSANITLQLDGAEKVEMVQINGADDDPRLPMWQVSGLERGDHELVGRVFIGAGKGIVYIDSVAVHNERWETEGFDLVSIGPHASDVPQEAVIVDSMDPRIAYTGSWTHHDVARMYDQTISWTTVPGDALSFTFEGTAIWYYADLEAKHANAKVTIDDGEPEMISSVSPVPLSRRLLWSKKNLKFGQHTLRIEHAGSDGQFITSDFFRILQTTSNENDSSSSSRSSASTSTDGSLETQSTGNQSSGNQPGGNQSSGNQSTGNQSTSNQSTGNQSDNSTGSGGSDKTGIIVGAVIGGLGLLVAVIALFLWYRRTGQQQRAARAAAATNNHPGPNSNPTTPSAFLRRGDVERGGIIQPYRDLESTISIPKGGASTQSENTTPVLSQRVGVFGAFTLSPSSSSAPSPRLGAVQPFPNEKSLPAPAGNAAPLQQAPPPYVR